MSQENIVSSYYTSSYFEFNKFLNTVPCSPEAGRSMVEMLGVLAVMGVLSLTGIAGYTYAMNRHHSNEMLSEAQMRAASVAAMILADAEGTSLAAFNYNKFAGGEFSTSVDRNTFESGFAILASSVPKPVCKNLVNAAGGNSPLRQISRQSETAAMTAEECDDMNALAFIFNEDLSTDGVPGMADNTSAPEYRDYECWDGKVHRARLNSTGYDWSARCQGLCDKSNGYFSGHIEAINTLCCGGAMGTYYRCTGLDENHGNIYTYMQAYDETSGYYGSQANCYACAIEEEGYYANERNALRTMCGNGKSYYYCDGSWLHEDGRFMETCFNGCNGTGFYDNVDAAKAVLCPNEENSGRFVCYDSGFYNGYMPNIGPSVLGPSGEKYGCRDYIRFPVAAGYTDVFCNPEKAGSYRSVDAAMDAMCQGYNDYFCSANVLYKGEMYAADAIAVKNCQCHPDRGQASYFTEEQAESYLCSGAAPDKINYYCTYDAKRSLSTKICTYNDCANGSTVTYCDGWNNEYCHPDYAGQYTSWGDAKRYMCKSGTYYSCSYGSAIYQGSRSVANCACDHSGTYFNDTDAQRYMCEGGNLSYYYRCSNHTDYISWDGGPDLYCSYFGYAYCDDSKEGRYTSSGEAIRYMCSGAAASSEARYYYCTGDRSIYNDSGYVASCTTYCSGAGNYNTLSEAKNALCKASAYYDCDGSAVYRHGYGYVGMCDSRSYCEGTGYFTSGADAVQSLCHTLPPFGGVGTYYCSNYNASRDQIWERKYVGGKWYYASYDLCPDNYHCSAYGFYSYYSGPTVAKNALCAEGRHYECSGYTLYVDGTRVDNACPAGCQHDGTSGFFASISAAKAALCK